MTAHPLVAPRERLGLNVALYLELSDISGLKGVVVPRCSERQDRAPDPACQGECGTTRNNVVWNFSDSGAMMPSSLETLNAEVPEQPPRPRCSTLREGGTVAGSRKTIDDGERPYRL